MYFKQEIDVSLTSENTQILRRPSKFFNKVKSIFSGEMTPNQARQAEVIVSVLQRLNVALRAQGVTNLVSISVNGKNLFCASKDTAVDFDLAEGQTALVNFLASGEIKSVQHMELISEVATGGLRYIVDVAIRRKPERGKTPVSISVFGLLNQFAKQENESEDVFIKRITKEARKRWPKYSKLSKRLKTLKSEFSKKVEGIEQEINRHFPALSSKNEVAKRTVSRGRVAVTNATYAYFAYDFYYLPLWYDLVDHIVGSTEPIAEEFDWQEEAMTIGADYMFESDDDSKSNDSFGWISDSPDFDSGSATSCSSCSSCGGD